MPDVMALGEDEEEVDQGRNPRTRLPPVGMTKEEMRHHSLTHILYNPACRCCVAGRRKDNHHHQRSGLQQMQDDLESANAHVSADYFFPKDAPGHKGVTAIAIRDRDTKFLAGHVVEQQGAGQQGAVKQLLKDLRKMGHHDKVVIKTDQEISIIDLFKRVAKDRGASKTILETAPRSDSKANGEAENAVQSVEQMARTFMVDLEERCGKSYQLKMRFTLGWWNMCVT